MKISANPRRSDFRNNLKHPITIEGIKVTDSPTSSDNRPQIVITRSLASNLQSKCLCSNSICSIPIIYNFILSIPNNVIRDIIFKLSAQAQVNLLWLLIFSILSEIILYIYTFSTSSNVCVI